MLGLSSTEVFFFFASWFILCCRGSIGHEIGGRAFLRYVQKGPEVVCVLSKGADTSCRDISCLYRLPGCPSVTNV